MNYDRSELGERLAGAYALGLMPPRARRRFERAMAHSASLAAAVAEWSERLAPLDSLSEDTAPPAHVWRGIAQRIEVQSATSIPRQAAAPTRPSGFRLLWRGVVVTALGACAAIAIAVALDPAPLRGDLHALAGRLGLPGWVGTATHAVPDIGLSTMRLGVTERERPRWLRAALLLTNQTLSLTTEPNR